MPPVLLVIQVVRRIARAAGAVWRLLSDRALRSRFPWTYLRSALRRDRYFQVQFAGLIGAVVVYPIGSAMLALGFMGGSELTAIASTAWFLAILTNWWRRRRARRKFA